MTGNTDWHAPKGTPKTKAAWWDRIRPYHEQGRRAFIAGVPKADSPLDQPYNVSWAKGWEAEERETAQRVAREGKARDRQSARDTHDAIHSVVSEKLLELGIDPYQLRDYLAGLPSED